MRQRPRDETVATWLASGRYGSGCKQWEVTMDKDRTAGVGHQVKGSIKEAAGKVTGNDRLKAEGKVEKTGGKLQKGIGKGKDALRDAAGSLKG
jgi:uncharacterized protein YjbJ (UPF0337 family)